VPNSKLVDDVQKKSLEHLSNGLVGAADEDLLRPVVVCRHLVQQPLNIINTMK